MLSENFPEVLQTRHDYLQGRDRELHQFLKCVQTKKPFPVLYLFGDISAETWMKQKLHNTSLPSCYKTESFAKKHFIKKFTKLIFDSNFTVNVTVSFQLSASQFTSTSS